MLPPANEQDRRHRSTSVVCASECCCNAESTAVESSPTFRAGRAAAGGSAPCNALSHGLRPDFSRILLRNTHLAQLGAAMFSLFCSATDTKPKEQQGLYMSVLRQELGISQAKANLGAACAIRAPASRYSGHLGSAVPSHHETKDGARIARRVTATWQR